MATRLLIYAGTAIAIAGCSGEGGPPGAAFDAGAVFAQRTPLLSQKFIVKNTTGREINILGETHSCTCTEVDIARMTLKPGQATSLLIHVRIPDGHSKSNLVCTVLTDHPEWPEWTYGLGFESFPTASIVPDKIDLGEIQPGSAADPASRGALSAKPVWLEVYAPEGAPLPRPGSVSCPPELSATLDPRPLIDAMSGGVQRARYRLTVGLNGLTDSLGTFVRPVSITVAGMPAEAQVIWRPSGPLALSPSRTHFGMIGRDSTPIRRVVVVRSTGGRPFRILSAEGGSPAVAVRRPDGFTFPTAIAKTHLVELVFEPPVDGAARAVEGVARIKTDLDAMIVVSIPWSAFLRRSEERIVKGTVRPRLYHEEDFQ